MPNRTDVDCTVVYVDFNTTALLLDSLRSLRAHPLRANVEIVVVDNASPTFDAAAVEEAWPGATVVRAGSNLGFGQGNNLGAKHASGRFLLLMNTDTIVEEDHRLEDLITFLDAHQEVAAATPLLLEPGGAVQAHQTGTFPTAARLAAQRLGVGQAPSADTDPAVHLDGRAVDWATAAALFVRRTAWDTIGGFSPEFFMYMEDVDLCRKLRERGFQVWWWPRARVTHIGGGSRTSDASRRLHLYRSQILYFGKWRPVLDRVAIRAMTLPLVVRYRLAELRRRRTK